MFIYTLAALSLQAGFVVPSCNDEFLQESVNRGVTNF